MRVGGWHVALVYNGSRSMLPCLIPPPSPPPPPPHTHTHNPSTIFLLSHFFLAASLNYNDSFYHTLLIGKTVSLKFNRLCFNSVLWYFTFFSYLLDFLLVKGLDLDLDIGLHFQLLAQCTDYYCSVDVLSLLRSRFKLLCLSLDLDSGLLLFLEIQSTLQLSAPFGPQFSLDLLTFLLDLIGF